MVGWSSLAAVHAVPDPDYTGIAVAVGRVEEKINNITTNRENDIAFQQSVRDTFTDHEKRLVNIESSVKLLKWLFTAGSPILIFAATWFSNFIIN